MFKIKIAFFLFLLALSIRLFFYFISSVALPPGLQKFVTADTIFYYDPLALKMAKGETVEASILSSTRGPFLNYLGIFYRYFGYRHWPVNVFHCFLSALSVLLLFLSVRIFMDEKSALIAGLVASCNIVLIYWSPFVTSETSFLLVLSLCLWLFGLFIKKRQPVYIFLVLISLVILSISRPQGIILTVFLALYLEWLILKSLFNKKTVAFFFTINIVIILGLASFGLKNLDKLDKLLESNYAQGLLKKSLYLDELPETKYSKDNKSLSSDWSRLTLPPGIKIPKINRIPDKINSKDLSLYFKKHFDKYLILFFGKIYTLFNPWVPEYSLRHNLFNELLYGSIYIFSFIGMLRLWKLERNFAILMLLAIASQVLLTGLTIVDYDFRLRLPLEFLLCIPAGVGIAKVLSFNQKES